jgi:hypothetical protein
MKRALWVALDLSRDGLTRRTSLATGVFLVLWLSFQAGLVEGALAQRPAWIADLLERSLSLRALWPGLAVATLTAEVIFTRRIAREMEPLLASPATARELVWGFALPALAALPFLTLASLPPTILGSWLTSSGDSRTIAGELAWSGLAIPAAGLWILVATIDAALHAKDTTALLLRSLVGFVPIVIMEGCCFLLRRMEAGALEPGLLLAGAAAGMSSIEIVAHRLSRQDLILRH